LVEKARRVGVLGNEDGRVGCRRALRLGGFQVKREPAKSERAKEEERALPWGSRRETREVFETSGEWWLAGRREELLPKSGSAGGEWKPLERRYEAERTCKKA